MTEEPRVLAARYRVDEVIGRGGMATVYRGYDLTLGRVVAVKILNRDLARDNVFRTRFRMEAQAASRMSNPRIVRVFDAGEDARDDGSAVPFIVMELVEGHTLKDVIARGPVPLEQAMRYTDGILEALEYSHRAGVIHRDIKPGNVMVTPDGNVKVMDFGIARAVSDSSSTVAETTSIIGTAAYFSPEQAKGDPIDARTDLYSTGVVLYELLTGRQPFRGDTAVSVAYQHVSETPRTPSEVIADLPRTLDEVVLRALAKDPYNRYPDAATFRLALTGARGGQAPSQKQLEHLTNELYGPNPRAAAETARSLRQLSADTTMTRTQQGPPVAWIWAGVAVVAVLIVSVVFWVVSISKAEPPQKSNVAVVSDVSGVVYEKAAETLKKAGLKPVRIDEPSASVPEDVVIKTDPGSGAKMEKNSEVRVLVSSGIEKVKLPKLAGLDEEAARKAITDADLEVGSVNRENNPTAAAGTVLSITGADNGDLTEGQDVAVGSIVNLRVATGKVVVEDFTGRPLSVAEATLSDKSTIGLKVSAVADASCKTDNPPRVKTQSLIGDVAVKSTITLTYCTGK